MRQVEPVFRSFRARSVRSAFALASLGLLFPAVAAGQQGSDDTVVGVDQIVVTITKRSESLGEVAASISAFDSQLLDDANIEHMGDALRLIPNANIKGQSGADSDITIRGISRSFSSQSPVAMHVNGIFKFEGNASFVGQFYDLEALEVQRGPVGTVYGRNATAGAVNVRWKKPHAGMEASGDATFGNFDLYQFRGLVNVPLLGQGNEALMGRLVFQREVRDGYHELLNTTKSATGEDRWGLRGSLRSVLSEDLEINLRGHYNHRSRTEMLGRPIAAPDGGYLVGQLNLGPLGNHPFDPLDGYAQFLSSMAAFNAFLPDEAAAMGFVQTIFPFFDFTPAEPLPANPRKARSGLFENFSPSMQVHGVDGDLSWQFHDVPVLGDISLDVLGGWERIEFDLLNEVDGTELAILDAGLSQETDVYTGEIRLSSAGDGPVDWIAGVFWFDREWFNPFRVLTPFGLSANDQYIDDKGWAPFLSASVRPLELFSDDPSFGLEVFGGIRRNKDEVSNRREVAGLVVLDGEETFRELTYEAGARVFPMEGHMAYLKYSKGYKAGLLEAITPLGLPSFFNPVDEEIVRAWEIGWKGTWLDGRLTTSLTYFNYTYANLQVPQLSQQQVLTLNAASADNQGVELELDARLTPEWSFQLAAGWLDAEFGDFCANDPIDFILVQDPGCDPGERSLEGNDLEDAPAFNVAFITSYALELGDMGTITPVLKFEWTDDYFRSPFNRPHFDPVDSHTRTDVRIRWESVDGRYTVEIFGENLENEVIYGRVVAVEIPASVSDFGILPPRTFGIRVGFRFGGD